MLLEIIIVMLLLAIIAALSVIISRLSKRNTILEDWVIQTYYNVDTTLNTMRQLDEKEMFEKDDEVGQVFEQLKNIVIDLYTKTNLPGETIKGDNTNNES